MSLAGFSVDGAEMRPEQKRILTEMERLVSAGSTNIIVSAPTGVGKSFVAKAVAEMLGPAWIVTSTKHLQDQYAADFRDVKTIKGMANFPCYQLMSKKEVKSDRKAMKDGLTCDRGQCTTKMGKIVVSTCPHKTAVNALYPTNADHAMDAPTARKARPCHYYLQKAAGLRAGQAALSYALYFSLTTRQPDIPGVIRPAVVFDEAHTIEDEAVRFVSKDIRASYFEDTRLDPTDYDMESLDDVLRMLLDLRNAYARLLQVHPDEHASAERIIRYKTRERRFEAVTTIRAAINAAPSNFVLQEPQWDDDGFKMLSVVPLDMSRILPRLLGPGLNIFMSATIRPAEFARMIGLEKWESIEIAKSPFPAGHRRVSFLDVARLNMRSPPEDELRVARAVDGLISAHRGERGLILTSSKARCRRLLSRLGPESACRVSMAHSENEGNKTLGEIMKRHASRPDSVLLSSSLWQGVDLKGDLSRFQIVEKCPWPYLGDRRVEALARADSSWYDYKTIVKVLQGFGRSVRGPDDRAVTYVMDSTVNGLLNRCRHMVPPAYHDVVYAA